MPRDIPLKKVYKEQTQDTKLKDELSAINPYDIILGNVELNYETIPELIIILKNYQNDCEKAARYMEAEVAKHRISDLKVYMTEFKKEIVKNYHQKEFCEVEEAYLVEWNKFTKFWEQKVLDFEEQTKKLEFEFAEKQKQKYDETVEKQSQTENLKKNCLTNDVLNLQKIEHTLARQKNYLEAQRTRIEWQEKINRNFRQINDDHKKIKLTHLEDYEKKQQKEFVDFQVKMKELPQELEKTRKKELDKLIRKYEKIKNDLANIQDHERKTIENGFPISFNPDKDEATKSLHRANEIKLASITEKKKMILSKISRLDVYPQKTTSVN